MKEKLEIETPKTGKNNELSEKGKKLDSLMFREHYKISLRVLGITVGWALALGAIGYFLDQMTGKAPAFTILGVVVSIPFAQYTIYKNIKRLTEI
jgi:F0F1-type ATP synthase assembly protein I